MASNFLTSKVDTATAKVCNDYEGRKMHTTPERKRAMVRLMVVLAVAGMTIWAVEWIAMNDAGFRIHEDSKDPIGHAQKNFDPLPTGSIIHAPRQPAPNLTCPCREPADFPWCKFINFSFLVCEKGSSQLFDTYTYSAAAGAVGECKRPADVDSRVCKTVNNADVPTCIDALDTIFDFIDTQTHIINPNLLSSFDLYTSLASAMSENIYKANKTALSLNATTPTPGTYNNTLLVLLLLESMVKQAFDCNPFSSMTDFWNAAHFSAWDVYPQLVDQHYGAKFAFGLAIDWNAYSKLCNPSVCSKQVKKNFNTRLMDALGQVGGVASLILLGIRFLIWPIVTMICRFPRKTSVSMNKDLISGVLDHI